MRKGEQKVDTCTAQKMTFSIKDLFGKCDQIQETPWFAEHAVLSLSVFSVFQH